jgi:hypothetical protein
VIAGMTTLASVQNSVNQVSRDRVRLLNEAAFAAGVTDDLDPFVAPSQVHIVGQLGEDALGVRFRVAWPDGFTLLGGFSTGRLDYRDITASNELTGALTLRYAPIAASRPFVEIGVLAGGSDQLTETRTYANGRGVTVGEGTTTYRNDAYWARLGWVWDAPPGLQVGAYAEFGRSRQTIGGYQEPLSNIDPFEALVGPGEDEADIGKLGVRYDQTLPGGWELFGALAVAHTFSQSQLLPIAVDGFGPLTPAPIASESWVEYRVRAGHALDRHSSVSLFVAGTAGGGLVSGDVVSGIDYKRVF